MGRKDAISTSSTGAMSTYFADAVTREIAPPNRPPVVVPAAPAVPSVPVVATSTSTSADKSPEPYSQSGHKVVIKTYAVRRG